MFSQPLYPKKAIVFFVDKMGKDGDDKIILNAGCFTNGVKIRVVFCTEFWLAMHFKISFRLFA